MPGRLVERRAGQMGAVHILGPVAVTIGRGEDNDVVVAGSFVSLRHAEIRWDGAQHVLADTSKNGTFVNGQRLDGDQPLAHGDVIVLPGLPSLALVFESSQHTATWVPEAAFDGTIRVDTATGEVWAHGRLVHVRPKEYHALVLLAERKGALVTKAELATRVWPEHGGVVSDDDIAQVIAGLRRKLEENPERPQFLLTVRGLGYRLVTL